MRWGGERERERDERADIVVFFFVVLAICSSSSYVCKEFWFGRSLKLFIIAYRERERGRDSNGYVVDKDGCGWSGPYLTLLEHDITSKLLENIAYRLIIKINAIVF